jgi:D-xylose 1-dehydrogenase (NADP+, D-xylono-1,5-lactone-forming)
VLRWGILSTARIAEDFVRAVRSDGRSEVEAVASRDAARAGKWAQQFDIGTSFGSYEELLQCPAVDAIYIAVPNSMHAEWTIQALEAGKHVLCEKPMALTASDVDRVFQTADRTGRLVMEGFMFRHHPVTHKVAHLVADGLLGEVVTIRSWHGFIVDGPNDIRYNAALGGGALADLGSYCLAGTQLAVAGPPRAAVAWQTMTQSGVDESTQALLGFEGGTNALVDCSLRIPESAGLHIVGTEAQIEVPQPWFPHLKPQFWLVNRSGKRTLVECPGGDSYVLEVENFCRAVVGEGEAGVTRELSRSVAAALELIASTAHRVLANR